MKTHTTRWMAGHALWLQGMFAGLEFIPSFLDYRVHGPRPLIPSKKDREGGGISREQSWSTLRNLGNGSSPQDSDCFICETPHPHCGSEQSRILELSLRFVHIPCSPLECCSHYIHVLVKKQADLFQRFELSNNKLTQNLPNSTSMGHFLVFQG